MADRRLDFVLAAGCGAGLLLAASGELVGAAFRLLRLLPWRLRFSLLGGEPNLIHARLLTLFLGLALAAVCGLALWRRHLRRLPDFAFLAGGRGRFLVILLAFLVLLALGLSVNRIFWTDEIEHVHAAWYVQNGQTPYRDFFEHHHPLLWVALAPLISLLGEGLAVLAAARLLMLLLAVGIAWLTWRIARLAGGNAETGLLAVALLFSQYMFVPCVIEIRPDVPMAFLSLAALERVLAFMKAGRTTALPAAAFLAALSFLFLQKSVALLPAAALLVVGWRLRGRIPTVLFWQTVAAFLLPLALAAAWMVLRGAWGDYFLCNWVLNAGRRAVPSAWLGIGRLALYNAGFWLALGPAFFHSWRERRRFPALAVTAWFAAWALAGLLLYRHPADRHFMLPLPLLSVVAASWAVPFARRLGNGCRQAALLAVLVALPSLLLLRQAFPFSGAQLEKISFVLQRSAPGEKVLDGRCEYNLFRPDLHYFWFQAGNGKLLDVYRRLRGGERSDYDPCRLVREARPRFILFDDREWVRCGVWQDYFVTPWADLYVREDGG